MELTSDNTGLDWHEQSVLEDEWRQKISPLFKKLLCEITSKSRAELAATLSDEAVSALLATKNCSQKIYDVYGVARILGLVNEIRRSANILEELLKIAPYPLVYIALSGAYAKLGDSSKRLECLELAHEKYPDIAEIWNLLGSSLLSMNQKERGLELVRKSAEALPGHSAVVSNYLFNSHHAHELDCQKIFDDHKAWAKIHASNEYLQDHTHVPDPDRKLRIGYISSDFRMHPVGIIMLPIVIRHDRENFEVFGYSNILTDNEMTGPYRESFDHFRVIADMGKQEIFDMIVEDQIDILIDLGGHTGNNRLDVMTLKPAPVQVSYLGYFDTTGMDQIDYYLTDEQMSPPESQKYHSEELFYLPSTCLGYNILVKAPDIVASPVMKNGYITFGMYSNTTKINKKMVRLWTEILKNVKDSKLKMILKDGKSDRTVSMVLDLFKECDAPCDRLEIVSNMCLDRYYNAYADVDIMLDTYPYNGGMTTCDAFWMGVPIISLVGEHHFSRVGLSLLSAVGLEYFAVKTEDEYVAKASVLAAMSESLNKIRMTLRQRMQSGPVGNSVMQTKNIENAYREMWQRWCREQNGKNQLSPNQLEDTTI